MLERFAIEAVLVRRTQNGVDSYNDPVYIDCEPEMVRVLAQPNSFSEYSSELGADRPEGSRISMKLCLERSVEGSVKGADIKLEGKVYRVIGDPQPYPKCPTRFNRIVEAELVDG